MYTPGMMTDVVREVKEAARVREEALLSRVRSMVEERSWTMNETHLKMTRDLEELKVSRVSIHMLPNCFRQKVSKFFFCHLSSLKSSLSIHRIDPGQSTETGKGRNEKSHRPPGRRSQVPENARVTFGERRQHISKHRSDAVASDHATEQCTPQQHFAAESVKFLRPVRLR